MSNDVVLTADEDVELTDQQIEELLQRGKARVIESAQQQLMPSKTRYLPENSKIANLPQAYVKTSEGIAQVDGKQLVTADERRRANGTRVVEDPIARKKQKAEDKKATAGSQWFNLPKTDLTPALKQDLQLMHMREVLDPHRHFKKEKGKMKVPEFSQVGTLVEGPSEFYSGRLQKSDRKRTLVEQVLAGERESGKFKTKYNAIQERKKSGKKGHYKAMMRQKYGDRSKV